MKEVHNEEGAWDFRRNCAADMNSDLTPEKIKDHIGHQVAIVTYGDPAVNVALECEDCGMVLADCDA